MPDSLFDKDFYNGNIKVGSSIVTLRIFLDPQKYRELKYYVEQYYLKNKLSGGFENFLDMFNKIIIPLMTYTFQNDIFLKEASPILRKIDVKIVKTKDDTLAGILYPQCSAAYLPLIVSLDNVILEEIKKYIRTNRVNTSNITKHIEHEIYHYYAISSNQMNVAFFKGRLIEIKDKSDKLNALKSTEAISKSRILSQLGQAYAQISNLELILYYGLDKLQSEGLGTFRCLEHSQKTRIAAKEIRGINGRMAEAIVMLGMANVKENIDWWYDAGEYMWVIIALGYLKMANRDNEVAILVGAKRSPLEKFDECLNTLDQFHVTQIPYDIFIKTLRDARTLGFNDFLTTYFMMCGRLGISERNSLITKTNYDLTLNTIRVGYSKVNKALVSNGFKPAV